MKDIKTASKEKCALAFELAIKNQIRRVKGSKRKSVDMSEDDAQEMRRFYCKYVENNLENALGQIGLSSRRAASNSVTTSVVTFTLMLALIFTFVFRSFWGPIFSLALCAAIFYPLWKQRRTAQKIWAGRKALNGKTFGALEKMCLVLAANPVKTTNFAVFGGIVAVAAVSCFELVRGLIK